MPVVLEVPNPALPPEALQKMNMVNSQTIEQNLNKKGAQFLLNIVSLKSQAVTSTTLIGLSDFQQSITSSGGLLQFLGCFNGQGDGGINVEVALLIDGVKVVNAVQSPNTATAQGQLVIAWMGSLAIGQHQISIQCKVSSGTFTLNSTGFTSPNFSSLFVREDGVV